MQQRAIDEARVAQALELGGALRKGREEGRAEGLQLGREEQAKARSLDNGFQTQTQSQSTF